MSTDIIVSYESSESNEWDNVFDLLEETPGEVKTKTVSSTVTNKYISMTFDDTPDFKTTKGSTKRNSMICETCNKPMVRASNMLTCDSCGIEIKNTSNTTEDEYSMAAAEQCNVNAKGFIPIKITGKGSYGYQRSLLGTCANYKTYRKSKNLKELNNWNNLSKKHHIPKNVIIEANNMYAQIKEHGYVYRKDGKKGVLSACLYYACYANGISKPPSEIAQFCGIEERFHSLGDRILRELNEKGVITIPNKVNPICDYIDRYMELLGIDNKYKQFVIDLIDRADKKNIHILHDSKNNTKCVGAIYMLIDRIKSLRIKISHQKIEEECGISKTTFIRYYNNLCAHYKILRTVFKQHHIPMKRSWRLSKKTQSKKIIRK